MKIKSKGIAIVTAAALTFGSTAAFTFAASPGGHGGNGGPGGNMGGDNISVSAPANMGSSNFRIAGPNGINFGGSNTASNTNSGDALSDMSSVPGGMNGSVPTGAPSDMSSVSGGMNGSVPTGAPSDMSSAPGGMNGSVPSGVPSDIGTGAPDMNGTDFTVNTPTDVDGEIPSDMGGNAPDGNMAPPDFSGEAPNQTDIAAKIIEENGLELDVNDMSDEDIAALLEEYKPAEGEMPTVPQMFNGQPPQMFDGQAPDFSGEAPNQTDIAARIIEENGLDLDVNNMTDDEITALLEQYKPAEGEMPDMNDQNRPELPDMQNGGIFSSNNGLVGLITNIINKIASDYSIVFDAEQNIADKISEYLNEFMPANSEQNRSEFQQGGALIFDDQNRPTPPELQQDQVSTDINNDANAA